MGVGVTAFGRCDGYERLRFWEEAVNFELGGKEFGRTNRVLQPSACDFPTKRRNPVPKMFAELVKRHIQGSECAESVGFPNIVPLLEEVCQLPVSRLVIVVVGRQPDVIGIPLFQHF